METAVIIIVAMTGFAMGLYLSSQLSDWIDKNSKKQSMDYKTSKDILGAIYIAVTISAIGFIVYANHWSGNQHKKKVEVNIEPISQPVDMIMDSVDMDCGEYHGREGESEYGEYEYSKWMDQQ